MKNLSPRERRTLAIGIIGFAVIVACARIAPVAYMTLTTRQAQDRELIAEWNRARRSDAASLGVHDSLLARQLRLSSLDSAIFEAPSPAAAGAEIVGMLSDAARSATFSLTAIEVEPSPSVSSIGPFALVRVRAAGNGTVAQTTRFLQRLEEGPELIRVREVGMSQSAVGAGTAGIETIHSDVVIEALARMRVSARRN